MESLYSDNQNSKQKLSSKKLMETSNHLPNKQNQVGTVMLYGIPIVSLVIESQERLCLAQISNTLLKQYSYNEIHNRRVALGITCMQCTPVQLEILRRAGAMPVSSRRCGMITRREAERLCKSFLGDNAPPRLPDDFAFSVYHECAWGCRGAFLPSRYNSSRAKCIKCSFCGLFFSPNKFIFHSHRTTSSAAYIQPDAANFNSWRRHMKLSGSPPDDVVHAWEDVKAMFNGGTRKRLLASTPGASANVLSKGLIFDERATATRRFQNSVPTTRSSAAVSSTSVVVPSTAYHQMKMETTTAINSSYPSSSTPLTAPATSRVPPFSNLTLPISMIDYVWHNGISSEGIKQFSFMPYAVPWLENAKKTALEMSTLSSASSQPESLFQQFCPPNHSNKIYYHQSAFRPVFPVLRRPETLITPYPTHDTLKRHFYLEETLLPKKRCSRDVEKVKDLAFSCFGESIDNEICQSFINHGRCESVDKENELKKNFNPSVGHDSCKNVESCDLTQNYIAGDVKISYKKRFIQPSDPLDHAPCDNNIQKDSNRIENLDLSNVPKLTSLKTTTFNEIELFKFREFGPHLLEAISSLKRNEWNNFSNAKAESVEGEAEAETESLAIRSSGKSHVVNLKRTNTSKNIRNVYVGDDDEDDDDDEDEDEDDDDVGDDDDEESEDKLGVCEGDEDNEDNSGKPEEADEDDECVDVETTDDLPGERSLSLPVPVRTATHLMSQIIDKCYGC